MHEQTLKEYLEYLETAPARNYEEVFLIQRHRAALIGTLAFLESCLALHCTHH
jgi:hypothetical protein